MLKDYLTRSLRAALGLVLFGFGVYLSIQANIGLAPWDCLCMGVTSHIPMSYGAVSICVSVVVIALDLCLGEHIGLGTLLDAVLVGASVDAFTALALLPMLHNLWLGVALMIVGLFAMAFGMYVYMSAGLCCGPRDSMLVALGKRMRKVPIGVVNMMIMTVVLIIGALLGGPVGVGTVLDVFGSGLALQIVFRLLRFEPRDVQHENLVQMWAKLRGRRQDGVAS